jgi:ABC-type branched-subunit amino acid transport system ATPase component
LLIGSHSSSGGKRHFPSLTVLENLEIGSYISIAKKRKGVFRQCLNPSKLGRSEKTNCWHFMVEQQMLDGLRRHFPPATLDEPSMGLSLIG